MDRYRSVLCLCMVGCGSEPAALSVADGGIDAEPVDQLGIASTQPGAGEKDVPRDGVVEVVFASELEPATLDSTSFLLERNGTPVVGSVSYATGTRTATFTPDSPLALLTPYEATITTAVTDIEGVVLPVDHQWTFTIADGTWESATMVDFNAGDARDPQVAVDSQGNAVVVWEQSDGVRISAWATTYIAGTGWGANEAIETGFAGDAIDPQVAMDPTGTAVAVWTHSDGARTSIWANRYVPGLGWGIAESIDTDDAEQALQPQVGIDASGNAIAVWARSDGSRASIWANRYVSSQGWGTAEKIEADETGHPDRPQVAVSAGGDAMAVWHQENDAFNSIWANRYVAGTGWGTATLVETTAGVTAIDPQVGMDANGDAVAVWVQFDFTGSYAWANRYTTLGGWGTAAILEEPYSGNRAYYPQVAVTPEGDAVTVWEKELFLWSSRFTVATGWSPASPFGEEGNSTTQQIAVDTMGNALMVCADRGYIEADRSLAGASWANPIEIATPTDVSEVPQVAVVPTSGNAIAVWHQSDGTRFDIRASVFR